MSWATEAKAMQENIASILRIKGDKTIWAIFIILAMFSVPIVYSATESLAWKEQGGNTEYYLIKQVIMICLGIGIAYVFHWMHYLKFSKAAPILIVITPFLLIYTLAYGVEINDASRWVRIPFTGLTFQSSDFAKIALVVYLARVISTKQDVIKDFWKGFVPVIAPVMIVCMLIAPSDLSTALTLFMVSFLMMFIGRVDWKVLFGMVSTGVVCFALLIIVGMAFPDQVRVHTWMDRLNDFVYETGDRYQIENAQIAIADGGLFGVGPGRSLQQNYTPAPYSDMVYSTIIEEYGLIGGIIILAFYILLFIRVVKLVTVSPKAFGSMLAVGLSLTILLQAFLNMGVAVDLLPVTGLTLPLVSMGGTSLLFTCVAIGMILSVSRYVDPPKMANA